MKEGGKGRAPLFCCSFLLLLLLLPPPSAALSVSHAPLSYALLFEERNSLLFDIVVPEVSPLLLVFVLECIMTLGSPRLAGDLQLAA